MLISIPVLVALSAISAVGSHKTYWSRYEFDEKVPKILLGFKLALLALTFTFYREHSFSASLLRASLLVGVYIVTLFASIAVYRLFLHPTRHFQGPFWSRLSTWWKVKHIAKAGSHYGLARRLHQQYGEMFRWGPNNISINNVEALQAIYGSQSTCTKPPSYLIGGLVSVQSERDPHRHRMRRAVWDKALGSNASNAFFPRLTQMVDLLAKRIEDQGDKEVVVNDWMHFITFDVMAQLIFSRDWNQLATGKMHEGIKYASEYLQFAPFGTQVPWLAISLMKIPGIPEPQSAMMKFSKQALDERAMQEPETPDAMSHILSEKDPQAQQSLSRHDIESDVFMIMLAGADTSFSTLVNLCFYLALHPRYQDQIRQEVSPAFNDSPTVNWPVLSSANFLTALINETLRLHPPVPSGMPRVAPPEGLTIQLESTSTHETLNDAQSIHIPGNAVVTVPTYTLQRDERYWLEPESFIPERWTTKPEMIIDRRAWCPFSLGAYGCAGKYFALMEIKLVIARLVLDFEIEMAGEMSQEDIKTFLTTQQDWMTLQPAEMKLKFRRRGDLAEKQ